MALILRRLRRWITAMLGTAQPDNQARNVGEVIEQQQNRRLSRLTGKTPQQVREAAARRAEMTMRLQARRK